MSTRSSHQCLAPGPIKPREGEGPAGPGHRQGGALGQLHPARRALHVGGHRHRPAAPVRAHRRLRLRGAGGQAAHLAVVGAFQPRVDRAAPRPSGVATRRCRWWPPGSARRCARPPRPAPARRHLARRVRPAAGPPTGASSRGLSIWPASRSRLQEKREEHLAVRGPPHLPPQVLRHLRPAAPARSRAKPFEAPLVGEQPAARTEGLGVLLSATAPPAACRPWKSSASVLVRRGQRLQRQARRRCRERRSSTSSWA